MDPTTRELISRNVKSALDGTISFGAHVSDLVSRGVESYRVDFRERSSTYFMPSGEFHTVPLTVPDIEIGTAFDAQGVVAAIRGSQQHFVRYPEFIERAMRAGCVYYVVWLQGRCVSYFGRRGETHTEHFPG